MTPVLTSKLSFLQSFLPKIITFSVPLNQLMKALLLMRLWSLFFFLLILFFDAASESIPTKDISIKYDKFEKIIKEELSPLFQNDLDSWIQSLPSSSANPTDIIKSGGNINLKLPSSGDLDKFLEALVMDKYQGSTFKVFLKSLKSTNSYCEQKFTSALPKHDEDMLFHRSVLAMIKFENGKYVKVKSHDSIYDNLFSILFDNLYLSYHKGSAKTFRESFSSVFVDYSKLDITGTSREDVLKQFCSKIERVADPYGFGKIALPELFSDFEKFKIAENSGQFKLVYDESKSDESLKREDLLKNEAFCNILFYNGRVIFLRDYPENMKFFLDVSEKYRDSNDDESKHLLKIFDLIKNNTKTLYSEFFSRNLVLNEISINNFKNILIDSIFNRTLFSNIGDCFENCGIYERITLRYKFLSLPCINGPDDSVRNYIKWIVQDIKSPNEKELILDLEKSLKSKTIENYAKHLEATKMKLVTDKSAPKQELRKEVLTDVTKSKVTPKPECKMIIIIVVVVVFGGGVVISIIAVIIYGKKRRTSFYEKGAQEVKQFQQQKTDFNT